MQQIRPTKIVQFVIDPFQQPVSGADIRNDAVRKALLSIAEVSVVSPQSFSSGAKRLSYSKSTPTLLAPDDACMQNFVNYIQEQRPHIVLFEGVALLNFCEHLNSSGDASFPILILDCHNAESALLEEIIRAGKPGIGRRFKSLRLDGKLTRARKADARAMHLFERVLVPTHVDRRRLAKLVDPAVVQNKIRVISNIAPKWALDHLALAEKPLRTGRNRVRRLLFVGHLRYRPNVDAVDNLLGRIWPRLVTEYSDMHLCIAGRDPKSRVRRWVKSASNVQLIANPDFMQDLYSTCDAVVVPLSSGGGSRLKILEALAVGKPVIASAKAVEGLDLVDGRHWLQAETPEDYAQAISRIDANPDLADELVENGRALISIRYNEHALASVVKSLIAELTPGELVNPVLQ